MPRNKARRKITREWEVVFNEWRQNSIKYCAALERVETFELWENNDDQPADVQVACNILEHLLDADKALAEIKKLSRQAAIFCIELDALRSKERWCALIEKYFTVMQVQEFDNRIVVMAAPVMKVPGIIPIAAGTVDGRWANIESNCKAVSHRVQRAAPHKRKAVIACYGPSLKDNIEKLMDEWSDPSADLISVSGSHDYLLEQGIVPRFHVECDPRPHKADNINHPNIGVEYLLGSQVDPSVVEKLRGQKVSLWHLADDKTVVRLKDELEPHAWFVGGRGNVGISAIALLHDMGYRDFSIFGMDCSFSNDGAERWAGAHASKVDQKETELIKVKVDEREFVSSHIYLTYATCFFEVISRMREAQFRLYGDNLLKAWAEFNQSQKQQEAA